MLLLFSFLYLIFGFVFTVWLARLGVLTISNDRLWVMAWFFYPLVLVGIIYLLLNAFVLIAIRWDE